MKEDVEYQGVMITACDEGLRGVYFPSSLKGIFDSYAEKGNWEGERIVAKTWLEAPADEKTIFQVGRNLSDLKAATL